MEEKDIEGFFFRKLREQKYSVGASWEFHHQPGERAKGDRETMEAVGKLLD